MESMRPKHKLQFSEVEDEEEETSGLLDSKRPRLDDNEDEIGQFFALVDRIRAMNEIRKQKQGTFDPAEATSTAAKNMEGKIRTSKSLWKPSFEWEDFSYGDILFDGNCRYPGGRDSANNSASTWKEIQKPDIGSGEGCKVSSSDKHKLVESFDLNTEAPLENPASPIL